MKCTAVYLLLMCALVAHCAAAEEEHTIRLRGQYNGLSRLVTSPTCLPGHPCPMALPSGPNETIWHGNGECSILFLSCEFDRILLRLYSPRSSSEVVVWALGDGVTEAPSDAYPSGISACSRHVSHGMVAPAARAADGAQTNLLFSTEQCGTKVLHPDPDNTCHEIQTNNIKVVEFLEVSRNVPAIHYVSTTKVAVECCVSCGAVTEAVCPVKPAKDAGLARWTAKSFSFKCSSDSDTERFRCDLSLNAIETLGTQNVGYHVESCRAKSTIDHSHSVELFSATGRHGGLQIKRQVCNAANVDTTSYIVEGPIFQFHRDPAAALDPHAVHVDCTVKLVSASELAALHLPLNDLPDLCNGVETSDVGYINAGELTVIQ